MAAESADRISFNRPVAKECVLSYRAPDPPANPVVRGLVLHYAAQLVASSGFIQRLLWANAGFDKLRDRPELDDADPVYLPLVINASKGNHIVSAEQAFDVILGEDWQARQPGKRIYPSISDYHEAYKSGRVTPTAVAEALLPLIRRDVAKPTKHATAFLQTRVDFVLKAAAESTQRYKAGKPLSPLDGVPVAVKDEADVSGYRKNLGSNLDFTRKDDATSQCVQYWLDAGAVLIGKTTMHELGMDTSNNNPIFGTPLNPYNERYYTGGSSGGSAYAVGAGLVPIAIGADGGGSIRIPSAYCGIYGLKPSHGRVSIRPTSNLAKSTAVAGPIAANMSDLEIAYRCMAQPDPLDNDAKLFVAPGPVSPIAYNRKVLGVYKTWFDRADVQVQKACHLALDYLTTQRGYEVIDISIPLIHDGQVAHAMTILCEVASGVPSVAGLTPANKILIPVGRQTPGTDFLQAQKVRALLLQHLAFLYKQHPGLIVVTPTTPNAGWSFDPADLKYGCSDGNMQIRTMEYCWLANFTGCPALSVPVGYVEPLVGEGRVPIGLMGMGEWCGEDELMAFGYECEEYLHKEVKGGRVRPGNFVDVLDLARSESSS